MSLDAFSFVNSELSWRFPLAFQLFFVLVIYLTAFWLPESPRWLLMKHRSEEALEVMIALNGARSRDDAVVWQDFIALESAIALEHSTEAKRETKPMFRLILGIGVQAMQQLYVSFLSSLFPLSGIHASHDRFHGTIILEDMLLAPCSLFTRTC